jgi:hypothetical protein
MRLETTVLVLNAEEDTRPVDVAFARCGSIPFSGRRIASSVDSLSGYTAASTSPVLSRLGQVVVIRNSGQISIAAGFLLALSREIIPLDDHTRLHRFVVGCHPLPKGPIRDAPSLDDRSVS